LHPGFGLVQHLAVRDDVIVFAGARNPSSATALNELATKHQGKVHVVKLTSADEADNRAAVDEIKKTVGRLDVVIANAAIGTDCKPVLEASIDSMQDHFTVNTLGTMALIQATYPLLKASTSTPKFVAISSRVGSIATGAVLPFPQTEYGTSKAAVNWMIKKLWTENPGLSQYTVPEPCLGRPTCLRSASLTMLFLVTFSICPGFVDTPGSRAAMKPEMQAIMDKMGIKAAPLEDGTRRVLEQIDKATRETSDFIDEQGKTLPW
jgi:hypothetical protein